MGNLALHSAEEPDTQRAITGTAEVPTKRDNDAALALGARPIQQHEPAALHNGAQRGATADIDGAPVFALHAAQSPEEHAERLPRHDGSPSLFVPETPEGAARFPKELFGAVKESPGMTLVVLDSTYVSRPMEPDAVKWTTPAPSKYQTPSTDANWSTLPPSLMIERADKSEQTPELPRNDNRASPSLQRKAQSTQPTDRSRARLKSKSSTLKGTRGRLRWNELDDTVTEAKGSSSDDEQKAPASRTSSRRSLSNRLQRSLPQVESSSSSSSDSSIHEHAKPKHMLKPPKYDGTGSFETFFAQFQNCASYNKWTKKEQLVYLRSSLEKDAGQVLWDYSAETTASLTKMIKVLKERFGEANQSDKYRLELKSRRRQPNEPLRNLHSDIRRLTALALPELDHKARETMACDYFIDALNDPNLALKVRERFPKDLDAALRVALQLEVWSKDVDQSYLESTRKERRTREIANPEKKDEQTDMLKKQVAEPQKQLTELQKKDHVAVLTKLVAELEAHLTEAKSSTTTAPAQNTAPLRATTGENSQRPTELIPPKEGTCWGCGDPRHRLWACPKLSNAEKRKLDRRRIRPIGEHSRPV